MRHCLILGFCLLAGSMRAAPADSPWVDYEEKQFNFYPGGKVEITAGLPGSVRVQGWHQAAVSVRAEKIAYYAQDEDGKDLLAKSQLQVRWNPTRARILTSGPSPNVECNLTVYVPQERTDILVKIARGDLTIQSVNGWAEATIQEGSLEARALSGYFSGLTYKGDLRVTMTGKRWEGQEFAAVTQCGAVDLELPAEYSAALSLETRNGQLTVDYPPQVVEGEAVPPKIVSRKNGQLLTGAVGDGGSAVKLTTYLGNVTLRKP